MKVRKQNEIYSTTPFMSVKIFGKYLFCILLWGGQSGAAQKETAEETLRKTQLAILTDPRDKRHATPCRVLWKSTRVSRCRGQELGRDGARASIGFSEEKAKLGTENSLRLASLKNFGGLQDLALGIKAEEYCVLGVGGAWKRGLDLGWIVVYQRHGPCWDLG